VGLVAHAQRVGNHDPKLAAAVFDPETGIVLLNDSIFA